MQRSRVALRAADVAARRGCGRAAHGSPRCIPSRWRQCTRWLGLRRCHDTFCFARSVAETDWRSELQTFQHGVEADTQRTAAEARAKSLEAVHSLGSLGALGSLTGDWARVRERVRGSGEGPPADPGGSASADGLDAARVAQSLTQARLH